jgi:hypothetical protein
MSVELPEDAFSALRTTPEGFVAEMRLAAAVKWYELGLLSQSKAAEVAGVFLSEPEMTPNVVPTRVDRGGDNQPSQVIAI